MQAIEAMAATLSTATPSQRAGRSRAIEDPRQLLFFSTRQGRQSNCVATVEIARYFAEQFDRRLVLPTCHTSPLGEQACSRRPDLPPQRQLVVPFVLSKVLQPRDLARCHKPPPMPASGAPVLLTPDDVPISASPRNVTCVEVVNHGTGHRHAHNPCASELLGDDALRTQLSLRFVRHVTITRERLLELGRMVPPALAADAEQLPASRLAMAPASWLEAYRKARGGGGAKGGGGAGKAGGAKGGRALAAVPGGDGGPRFYDAIARAPLRALPEGDVYLHGAFSLFAKSHLSSRHFGGLCALPRETDDVVRMERALQRSLGWARATPSLCMHWRAEDFHHPTTLARHRQNGSAALAATQTLDAARKARVGHVLVLSNARFEALDQMLGTLRASGLHARSPRELDDTSFGCGTGYVYGTMAEMLACSRSRHFLGTLRSSFTEHIVAMRAARGAPNGSVSYLTDRR